MSPGRTWIGPLRGGRSEHARLGSGRPVLGLVLLRDLAGVLPLMANYHVEIDLESPRERENLEQYLEGLLAGRVGLEYLYVLRTS